MTIRAPHVAPVVALAASLVLGSFAVAAGWERVGGATREGAHVTQRITWSEGSGDPLAAIVVEDGAADASHHAARVLLYAGSAGYQRLLREEEFPWVHLERFADIDRDGTVELVFQAFTGSNCAGCSYVQAWSVSKGGVRSLVPPEKYLSLEAVDGDGTYEAISLDPRWESYAGLCHASTPRIERIHRLTRDGWVDVSSTYGGRYRKALAALNEKLDSEEKDSGGAWDDGRMGTLITILLHRLALGEEEIGWREFSRQICAWKDSMGFSLAEPRAHLDEIVEQLRRDLRRP
jgi:hypothetical protein